MSYPISYAQVRGGILVALGGFGGATARYLVELIVPSGLIATLTVNVLGCLVLGFVVYSDLSGAAFPEPVRLVLTTGFIASFTTYSTFVVDALTSTPAIALVYIVVSYTLGFGAVLVGRVVASRWTGTQQGSHL